MTAGLWADSVDWGRCAECLQGVDFCELFRTHEKLVWTIIRRVMPRDPDQEDVFQLACLEIYRSLGTYEGRAPLKAWIAGVTFNVAHHYLKRRRWKPLPVIGEIQDERSDPECRAHGAQVAARARSILEAMTPEKRSAFLWSEVLGWPRARAAAAAGVKLPTLNTRLFYARREFWEKARRDPLLAALAPKKAA